LNKDVVKKKSFRGFLKDFLDWIHRGEENIRVIERQCGTRCVGQAMGLVSHDSREASAIE